MVDMLNNTLDANINLHFPQSQTTRAIWLKFMEKPISPCISICRLNDEDICVGCYRSSEEIKNWIYLDDDQRQRIIDECLDRAKNS